jgi:hypothetical protein
MDKLDEHRDLRGLGCRKVILYIHGEGCVVLLCVC